MATVAATQLRDARAALRNERTRTAAERDAFVRFAHRADAIESDQSQARPSSTPHAQLAGSSKNTPLGNTNQPSGQSLKQVREAYREIVMAVPHYEEEYDESLRENLAAEFGDDVATAVCNTVQLTPPLRGALLQKSQEAH